MQITAVLIVTALLSGCAAGATSGGSPEAASTVSTPWYVDLTTDGGITGRGLGAARVDSSGSITATDAAHSCSGHVPSEQMSALVRALAKSRPESWSADYADPGNPHGNADMIQYTLIVETGGRKSTTRWYDGAHKPMPPDIAALRDAVWNARTSALRDCR